jgi:hypothetical protein
MTATAYGLPGGEAGAGRRVMTRTGSRPPTGNSCYHNLMAKTQLGARVDDEIAALARARAKDRGLSVGDYIAALVRDDADGLRQRGLDAARRFLDEHRQIFDEIEDEEAGSRTDSEPTRPARGVHAA